MKKHLAIFSPQVIKEIFAGRKTIESRFSIQRIPPFGQVSVGDLVYIKPPGEEIKGQFIVKKVIYFEGLDVKEWEIIRQKYGSKISLGSNEEDDKYFLEKAKSKYGSLIFLDQLEQFITPPVKIPKRDLRAWVVLD